MRLVFTFNAWEDFEYWLETDVTTADKIRDLLKDIKRDPFRGIGKPEPLKNEFKGFWSRRINKEHRLVYQVQGKRGEDFEIAVIQCRYHYHK